jgi:hypothetical protein
MWCILPHTWIPHLLSRFEDPVKLGLKSYISDRLIRESQHLASYVSHHNAMAYDSYTHTGILSQYHHGHNILTLVKKPAIVCVQNFSNPILDFVSLC